MMTDELLNSIRMIQQHVGAAYGETFSGVKEANDNGETGIAQELKDIGRKLNHLEKALSRLDAKVS